MHCGVEAGANCAVFCGTRRAVSARQARRRAFEGGSPARAPRPCNHVAMRHGLTISTEARTTARSHICVGPARGAFVSARAERWMDLDQKWLDEACAWLKQPSSGKAYREFLSCPYQHAEDGKRAEKRKERGCLAGSWRPDQLIGKSILVIGEDRVGDEVLTIGCLSDLVQTCEAVSWRCDPKLKVLFTRSFPKVKFVSEDDRQPTAEGTIYSWELIGRFRKQLEDFAWTKHGAGFTPYLNPSAALKDSLAAKYRDGSKKTVGLTWRSERAGELLSDKTCDIRDVPHWAEFFERLKNKVRFVSLQYGNTEDEIAFARWKYGVEIYQDKSIDILNDVDAAAAQIAAMDYVVSISTTAAHLAGAVGVHGWVLLQKKPFGHWRAGETICPWYPTLRPVKQATSGEWKLVLEGVAAKLNDEINSTGCDS